MDCWRQWIRHRTASVNEYSTRYSEAIDSQQTTTEWRLQAKNNKQGSAGLISDWPEDWTPSKFSSPSEFLSEREAELHEHSTNVYLQRSKFGVAREQARKDLPLSTYTEAYWKIAPTCFTSLGCG
jgi:thymidylate synthase (FAD)